MLNIDNAIAARMEVDQIAHEREAFSNPRQQRLPVPLEEKMHGVWQRYAMPNPLLIDQSKAHPIANFAVVLVHAGPPVVWVGLFGDANLTTGCVRLPSSSDRHAFSAAGPATSF
ncbi:hypothetical protein ACVSMD_00225, partial [Pseudomonas aeruginosa]